MPHPAPRNVLALVASQIGQIHVHPFPPRLRVRQRALPRRDLLIIRCEPQRRRTIFTRRVRVFNRTLRRPTRHPASSASSSVHPAEPVAASQLPAASIWVPARRRRRTCLPRAKEGRSGKSSGAARSPVSSLPPPAVTCSGCRAYSPSVESPACPWYPPTRRRRPTGAGTVSRRRWS